KYGNGVARNPAEAGLWLCKAMGIDPVVLGWRGKAQQQATAEQRKISLDAKDWPDPVPLPQALLPVAKFYYELLPEKLRPWVKDICERMQCPPDFVAVSVMVVLSMLIGRKVTVRPKQHDNWTVVCNLWGLIVGRPGVMKTPAMEAVIKVLKIFGKNAREAF